MKYLVAAALVVTLTFTAGCSLFRHGKKNRTPESPPAASVEAEFRSRWMQRRVSELLGSGAAKTDAEAQTMAAAEFTQLYPFIGPANSNPGR